MSELETALKAVLRAQYALLKLLFPWIMWGFFFTCVSGTLYWGLRAILHYIRSRLAYEFVPVKVKQRAKLASQSFDPTTGILTFLREDGTYQQRKVKSATYNSATDTWDYTITFEDGATTKECAQPDSEVCDVTSAPPSLVVFLDENDGVVGHGVYSRYEQKHFLITALHVVRAHAVSVARRCVVNGEQKLVKVPLNKKLVLKLASSKCDLCVMQVNPNLPSVLSGLKPAYLSGVQHGPVMLYSAMEERIQRSNGNLAEVEGLEIFHTATTHCGWSGTPLFTRTAGVPRDACGIHLRSASGRNVCVSAAAALVLVGKIMSTLSVQESKYHGVSEQMAVKKIDDASLRDIEGRIYEDFEGWLREVQDDYGDPGAYTESTQQANLFPRPARTIAVCLESAHRPTDLLSAGIQSPGLGDLGMLDGSQCGARLRGAAATVLWDQADTREIKAKCGTVVYSKCGTLGAPVHAKVSKATVNPEVEDYLTEQEADLGDYVYPPTGNEENFVKTFEANVGRVDWKEPDFPPEVVSAWLRDHETDVPTWHWDCFASETSLREHLRILAYGWDQDKSTGWWAKTRGIATKGDLLRNNLAMEEVIDVACARLAVYAAMDPQELGALTSAQLVQRGLCDPVVAFYKDEPTPLKKAKEGRFRYICCFSPPDDLIGRLLHKPLNNAWCKEFPSHIPNLNGCGLDDKGIVGIGSKLDPLNEHAKRANLRLVSLDVSGFDQGVRSRHWDWDCVRRQRAVKGPYTKIVRAALASYNEVLKGGVVLMGSALYEQKQAGIMYSGCVSTSASDSAMMSLAVYDGLAHVGECHSYSQTQGDDTVSAVPFGATLSFVRRLESQGMLVKECKQTDPGVFDMLSHDFVRTPYGWEVGYQKVGKLLTRWLFTPTPVGDAPEKLVQRAQGHRFVLRHAANRTDLALLEDLLEKCFPTIWDAVRHLSPEVEGDVDL
jgi:hypothetical protein